MKPIVPFEIFDEVLTNRCIIVYDPVEDDAVWYYYKLNGGIVIGNMYGDEDPAHVSAKEIYSNYTHDPDCYVIPGYITCSSKDGSFMRTEI